ncbi:Sec-independent protein translocase subunit TatA [Mobilicoccus pelagius]|uniref:Sec-independent protein translocase protein TatA n=1 Tax=Mobilicoccus pelagius NBRC 104925 TaxID=1089455 RepID=H5UTF4_9MICO|nr:Sec-independent protein translocase subunit TatA [Mobilicoccus pelagius]GAB49012.1 Sec-independent protein translocase protein TatA/E homolog [Mobilicoccus pelagius NBRC 104925]
MPNLGPTEFLVIVLILVVLFGAKKLPDAARSLGRSMRIFKAEVEEMKDKPSAASRETVQGEARRETRTETHAETLAPEDHRAAPTETRTTIHEERVVDGAAGDADPQYRPPMA